MVHQGHDRACRAVRDPGGLASSFAIVAAGSDLTIGRTLPFAPAISLTRQGTPNSLPRALLLGAGMERLVRNGVSLAYEERGYGGTRLSW